MKALSVIPSLAVRNGGPGVNLIRSVRPLREAGLDLSIVTTDMATPSAFGHFRRMTVDDLPSGSESCDIAIVRSQPPHRINFAPKMHSVVRAAARRSEVVRLHGMYLYSHLAAYVELRRLGRPYFVSPHGALDPYIQSRSARSKAAFDAVWQTRVIQDAAFIHATTDDEAAQVRSKYPGLDVRVVPNGLDLQRFAAASGGQRFRQQWLGGWRGPVITCLGRLSHKKGGDVLIDAVATVVDKRDVRLLIVGPDDEGLTPLLEQRARSLGIAERVTFTGALYGDEQLAALDATNLWVLPSRGENFGNAVVEAMAAGCPVIVSPEVGLASVLRANDAGIVTTAQKHDVAAAIECALASPELSAIATRGRQLVRELDWTRIGPRMAELFDDCRQSRVPAATTHNR